MSPEFIELIPQLVSILMFVVAVGFILTGYPVAFTLAGTALLFAFGGHLFGIFELSFLIALTTRYFGFMVNPVLVAVPMFIFMGVMLERSQIAEALLQTMGEVFGPIRGGLGISVVLVGALLAASTGILGATVVTMGLLSLPIMLRNGYDPKLATGLICASGTLGQIIPPSIVLIFMATMLQTANQTAAAAIGNFSPDQVSVSDLFAGAFIPGFILVGAYISWILVMAVVRPSSCPAVVMTPEERRGLLGRVFISLVPPLFLIIAVLGSILFGIASPTESSSVGAVGATLLAISKRRFSLSILQQVMQKTLRVTSMVFVILIGASVFSLVFRGFHGDVLVENFLRELPGGKFAAIFLVMGIMFLLGFFLDAFEILFIVLPIAGPILLQMDISAVWLGVIIGVNLQTSFLTPPFGFALFYLRGVAPKEVSTGQIYKGIIPFVGLQVFVMGLLVVFPGTVEWLPNVIFPEPEYSSAGLDSSGELIIDDGGFSLDNQINPFGASDQSPVFDTPDFGQ